MKKEYYNLYPITFKRINISPKLDALIVMLIIIIPEILLITLMTLVSEYSGQHQILLKLLTLLIGTALSFGWLLMGSFLACKIYRTDKYRLKVTDVDKYIRIIPLTDGDIMDELDRKGALWTTVPPGDDGYKKFIYNFLNDQGLIKDKVLTLYKIERKDFLDHFTYYEPEHLRPHTMYVIPYEDLGITKEKFTELANKNHLFGYLHDYTDLLDGYQTVYRGFIYRYKDTRPRS